MQRMAVILAMLLGARPLAAQEPQCNVAFSSDATAACNAAVDAVRAFYPLAGVIVNGGNPVLGTAGALGGFGHVAITVRANAVKTALPDPSAASQRPVPSSFDGAVPAPSVEGAVGLLRGLGGGVLAVDVLGSALVIPTGIRNLTVSSGATRVSNAALGIGYGLRVGLLRGAFPVPALSVSWMRRTVPGLRYGTLGPVFGQGDQFEFAMDLKADSYRAVAGWKFPLLDVAAGIGVDRYASQDTNIRFHDDPINPTSTRTVVINPTNTRAVVFVDGGFSLAAVNLVGEIGLQAGQDQTYLTRFSDFDPKAAHVFGGLGIRLGL